MKYKNIVFITLLIIISYEVISNSIDIMNSVCISFDIWKNNIFPSLFPFIIISHLLINYGIVDILSELLKPFMKLFKINSKCASILVMSIISGFPSSSIYTKELYSQNIINEYDASKILMFSHFSNPLFIIGSLPLFLGSNKPILLILIIHYLTNIIIGLIFRNYHSYIDNSKIDIKNCIKNINSKNINFGNVLSSSIKITIDTLLTILGTITFFLCVTTIINNTIDLGILGNSILNGIFEMTQGLKYLSMLDISLKYKSILAISYLSFGGLSIHMQIKSILVDTNIKYYPFLIARILHAIIASILLFILYDLII